MKIIKISSFFLEPKNPIYFYKETMLKISIFATMLVIIFSTHLWEIGRNLNQSIFYFFDQIKAYFLLL